MSSAAGSSGTRRRSRPAPTSRGNGNRSTGHVTLVVNDNVYEFKPKQPGNKGFVKTPTSDWLKTHKDGWTLRKLPSKPPLANM